jgi:hypothetical protein
MNEVSIKRQNVAKTWMPYPWGGFRLGSGTSQEMHLYFFGMWNDYVKRMSVRIQGYSVWV